VADALRRLYGEVAVRPPDPPQDLAGLIDVTWQAVGHPRWKAVLEAWLAMADDASLAGEIGPVVAEFAALVDPASLAPSILVDEAHVDVYLLAREALLGLALGRATNGGRPLPHEGRVLDGLRALAASVDRPHPEDPR
jgi:hypothetical protein